MTPPVEDIREQIALVARGALCLSESYVTSNYEKALAETTEVIATLFSTLLDGLKMEEQKQEHFGFMEGKDIEEMYDLADKEDTKSIALIDGHNQAVREFNSKISTIQKSLKGETE